MAGPIPSERGAAPRPEVKLLREMTGRDVVKIAEVTGGKVLSLRDPVVYEREPYSVITPVEIDYPGRDLKLNLRKFPDVNGTVFTSEATFSLENTAVVMDDESVTFVKGPKANLTEPGFDLATLRITKEDVTYKNTTFKHRDKAKINAIDYTIWDAAGMADADITL